MKQPIHDGERVRVLLAKRGMSMTEFAKRMGLARSTAMGLLQRGSWTTDRLAAASEILETDLFAAYSNKAKAHGGVLLLRKGSDLAAFGLERIENFDWREFKLQILPPEK